MPRLYTADTVTYNFLPEKYIMGDSHLVAEINLLCEVDWQASIDTWYSGKSTANPISEHMQRALMENRAMKFLQVPARDNSDMSDVSASPPAGNNVSQDDAKHALQQILHTIATDANYFEGGATETSEHSSYKPVAIQIADALKSMLNFVDPEGNCNNIEIDEGKVRRDLGSGGAVRSADIPVTNAPTTKLRDLINAWAFVPIMNRLLLDGAFSEGTPRGADGAPGSEGSEFHFDLNRVAENSEDLASSDAHLVFPVKIIFADAGGARLDGLDILKSIDDVLYEFVSTDGTNRQELSLVTKTTRDGEPVIIYQDTAGYYFRPSVGPEPGTVFAKVAPGMYVDAESLITPDERSDGIAFQMNLIFANVPTILGPVPPETLDLTDEEKDRILGAFTRATINGDVPRSVLRPAPPLSSSLFESAPATAEQRNKRMRDVLRFVQCESVSVLTAAAASEFGIVRDGSFEATTIIAPIKTSAVSLKDDGLDAALHFHGIKIDPVPTNELACVAINEANPAAVVKFDNAVDLFILKIGNTYSFKCEVGGHPMACALSEDDHSMGASAYVVHTTVSAAAAEGASRVDTIHVPTISNTASHTDTATAVPLLSAEAQSIEVVYRNGALIVDIDNEQNRVDRLIQEVAGLSSTPSATPSKQLSDREERLRLLSRRLPSSRASSNAAFTVFITERLGRFVADNAGDEQIEELRRVLEALSVERTALFTDAATYEVATAEDTVAYINAQLQKYGTVASRLQTSLDNVASLDSSYDTSAAQARTLSLRDFVSIAAGGGDAPSDRTFTAARGNLVTRRNNLMNAKITRGADASDNESRVQLIIDQYRAEKELRTYAAAVVNLDILFEAARVEYEKALASQTIGEINSLVSEYDRSTVYMKLNALMASPDVPALSDLSNSIMEVHRLAHAELVLAMESMYDALITGVDIIARQEHASEKMVEYTTAEANALVALAEVGAT